MEKSRLAQKRDELIKLEEIDNARGVELAELAEVLKADGGALFANVAFNEVSYTSDRYILSQEAAKYYIGTHDFSAFCGNKNMKKSTVRAIESFSVEQYDDEIVFVVTGNGFLQHMVRIMVGTLLEIGKGEREPESILGLFGAARSEAGPAVPASGLCLMEVSY